MAATTATARRRTTTTRAALSTTTAGVWSVHSGQGPAWGDDQQHAEQQGEMRPSESEVSVLVHDKWSTQLMQGSEADHKRNHSRGVWWTGLPSGLKTNQRLWMIIHNLGCKCLWTLRQQSYRTWKKVAQLGAEWASGLNYACDPNNNTHQVCTQIINQGCFHYKYYLMFCVASPRTLVCFVQKKATTTFANEWF